MSKDNFDKNNAGDSIIKNKNRVERKVTPFQSEYERLQIKPSEAGVPLIPAPRRVVGQTSSSQSKNDNSILISKLSSQSNNSNVVENDPQNFNSNIDAGYFPFNKKLNPIQKEWATLDLGSTWTDDEKNTSNVIESEVDLSEKFIDNNEYVSIEERQEDIYLNTDNNFDDYSGMTEIGNFVLLIKNKVILTNASQKEVQDLIEKIIYGEVEEFKNEELKSSDFSVLKRIDLYFGVSILG